MLPFLTRSNPEGCQRAQQILWNCKSQMTHQCYFYTWGDPKQLPRGKKLKCVRKMQEEELKIHRNGLIYLNNWECHVRVDRNRKKETYVDLVIFHLSKSRASIPTYKNMKVSAMKDMVANACLQKYSTIKVLVFSCWRFSVGWHWLYSYSTTVGNILK